MSVAILLVIFVAGFRFHHGNATDVEIVDYH